MKTKRFSYTTTLKNPLTWLAALLALAAAVGFLGRGFAPGSSCWTPPWPPFRSSFWTSRSG